jgi:serine/threonine protein kinase
MEFLDGINLQSLVEQYGPQPESRVIQMLLQICGSLYEAHSPGLVHRDIKPANIMLNRRGAQPDVVKVLDFGLVKDIQRDKQSGEEDKGLSGTPLYLSPEAIQSPNLIDACSDLYAVGAVGYFLLTGKTVFDASSVVDLLQKHITDQPIPPSQIANVHISEELEHVILSCLEKSRARRPQTARELAAFLGRCTPQSPWTLTDADSWWSQHERRTQGISASNSAGNSSNEPGRMDQIKSEPKSGSASPMHASEVKPTASSSDPLAQTFFVDK